MNLVTPPAPRMREELHRTRRTAWNVPMATRGTRGSQTPATAPWTSVVHRARSPRQNRIPVALLLLAALLALVMFGA